MSIMQMHPLLALSIEDIVLQVLAHCSRSSALHLGQSCKSLWALARGVIWADIPDLEVIRSLVEQHSHVVTDIRRNPNGTYESSLNTTSARPDQDDENKPAIQKVPDLRGPLPRPVTTYLDLVQKLHVTESEAWGRDTENAPSWAMLCLLPRERIYTLFPKLRAVDIHLRYNTGFSTAKNLLTTDLHEVRFISIGGCYCCGPFLQVEPISEFLELLTTRTTKLQNLWMAWSIHPKQTRMYVEPAMQAIANLLRARNGLEHLTLHFPITEDVFQHAARLQYLKSLKLNCRWMTSFPSNLLETNACFPDLRMLFLDGIDQTIALDCCTALSDSRLEFLALWITNYSEATMTALCEVIASQCPYLTKVDLRYYLPPPSLDSDEWLGFRQTLPVGFPEIPWSVFKPLQACRALDTLFVSFAYHIRLTDDDLEALALALPRLRNITIHGKLLSRIDEPTVESHVQPSVSMVGLLALIQRCPDLCTVTLPMSLDFGPPSSPAVVAPKQQAALRSYLQRLKQRYQRLKAMAKRKTIEGAVPPIVEVGDALMKDDDHLLTSSVTFLNVAYSPDPGNIANAARFFREVFPRLKDLRYEVMWTHSGAPDEPGEREQRRKDRWVGVRRALGFEGDGAQPHPNWVPVSWE